MYIVSGRYQLTTYILSLVEAMFESVKLLYRQVDQANLSALPGKENVSYVMGMQDIRTVNDDRLNVAGVDKREEDCRQGLNKGRFASNSWTNPRFSSTDDRLRNKVDMETDNKQEEKKVMLRKVRMMVMARPREERLSSVFAAFQGAQGRKPGTRKVDENNKESLRRGLESWLSQPMGQIGGVREEGARRNHKGTRTA